MDEDFNCYVCFKHEGCPYKYLALTLIFFNPYNLKASRAFKFTSIKSMLIL